MQVRKFSLSFFFFRIFPDLLLILLQPAWRKPSSHSLSIPWVSTSWYTFRVSQSSPITSFSLLSYTISTLLYHPTTSRSTLYQRPHNHHTCLESRVVNNTQTMEYPSNKDKIRYWNTKEHLKHIFRRLDPRAKVQTWIAKKMIPPPQASNPTAIEH